jgi:hypothetical protein
MNTTFHDDDSYFELNEYDYFGEFLINKFVKGYWTALFVLCLYWGFFWFVRHIFGYNDTSRFQNSRREETVIDAISGVGNNRSYHHQDSWVNHSTAMGISVTSTNYNFDFMVLTCSNRQDSVAPQRC